MGVIAADQRQYARIFELLAVNDVIPGPTMFNLFERAHISGQDMKKIWGLADPYDLRALDRHAAYVAFRLISLAQNQRPLSYPALGLDTDVPYPKFEGLVFPEKAPILPAKQEESSGAQEEDKADGEDAITAAALHSFAVESPKHQGSQPVTPNHNVSDRKSVV